MRFLRVSDPLEVSEQRKYGKIMEDDNELGVCSTNQANNVGEQDINVWPTCLISESHMMRFRCFKAARLEQNSYLSFRYMHIFTNVLYKYIYI